MIDRRRTITVALFVLCVSLFASGEKQRDWQTGKALDSERSRYFAGTVGNANTNGHISDNGSCNGNTSGSSTAIYRVYQDFAIGGEPYVYLAQEHIKWRWSNAANPTVNGSVKYAIEKRKLYVIDDGKEHEMEIIKKTLKTP